MQENPRQGYEAALGSVESIEVILDDGSYVLGPVFTKVFAKELRDEKTQQGNEENMDNEHDEDREFEAKRRGCEIHQF